MPGLIGFTDKAGQCGEKMLQGMRDLLCHYDANVAGNLFHHQRVWASRVYLDSLKQGDQPLAQNKQSFWFEGEIYNRSELHSKYGLSSTNDTELFSKLYQSTQSFDFLSQVDGCFVSVIYDEKKQCIHVINDRNGLAPIYWGVVNGELIWASELKGFLGYQALKPEIDPEAVSQFVDLGHLFADRSWFRGVSLLPPAAILSFDINDSRHDIKTYWSFEKITPLRGNQDEHEVIEELGRLFSEAIHKRMREGEKIGVSLSGGLDSRAIYATLAKKQLDVHAFTFGIKGCDEIDIAKEVVSLVNGSHSIFYIDAQNWFPNRISAVWRGDGMLNLLHMHGIEFQEKYSDFMDVHLSGYLGDATIGGFYLEFDPKHPESYHLQNRGRRFINQALLLLQHTAPQRRPFLDNAFMEFTFSLPTAFRRKSNIYKKMLLAQYPDYFKRIPWQQTGLPVAAPEMLCAGVKSWRHLNMGLRRLLGLTKPAKSQNTDYPSWMRQRPADSFINQELTKKDCLYEAFISREKVQAALASHARGEDRTELLCRYLTFEVWLQQVFNHKYRNHQELMEAI